MVENIAPPSTKAESPKILIVEDEPIVALDEKKQVESFGYKVLDIVTTGEEAVVEIEKTLPDLVLMDINLEGKMDGIEVAEALKERFDIPVVFITAHSEVDTLQRAKITAPYAYLIKPYREKDLKVAIEIALYKSKMERQLRRYRDHLEELVRERTLELKKANLELKKEISERKEAENNLRESRENYRNLFENNPVGIYRISPESRIMMANPALVRMMGYDSFRELQRIKFGEDGLIAEPSRALFIEEIEKKGQIKEYETRWSGKGGKVIFTRENAKAIYNKYDAVIYYEGTIENITDKKEAEEQNRLQEQQLIQADKMVALGTLVSGVAHEINNPNNFIMLNIPVLHELWNNAEAIIEEYWREKEDFFVGQLKYSEIRESIPILFSGIKEGAARIKNIVKELKDFARQDTSELNQSLDINLIVKSAITLTSNLIKKSTRNFSVYYGKNLPLISGNFQRVEQVVINLIQNSCQALQDETKSVFVSTSGDEESGVIVIKVKDEGAGIPPEIRSKITDPFFTTKRDIGGTGLGLSVSSKIIDNHGGSLYFKSKTGIGTEAIITLPVNRKNNEEKEKKKGENHEFNINSSTSYSDGG
jgi:PAS domain S-box-containing protein